MFSTPMPTLRLVLAGAVDEAKTTCRGCAGQVDADAPECPWCGCPAPQPADPFPAPEER